MEHATQFQVAQSLCNTNVEKQKKNLFRIHQLPLIKFVRSFLQRRKIAYRILLIYFGFCFLLFYQVIPSGAFYSQIKCRSQNIVFQLRIIFLFISISKENLWIWWEVEINSFFSLLRNRWSTMSLCHHRRKIVSTNWFEKILCDSWTAVQDWYGCGFFALQPIIFSTPKTTQNERSKICVFVVFVIFVQFISFPIYPSNHNWTRNIHDSCLNSVLLSTLHNHLLFNLFVWFLVQY